MTKLRPIKLLPVLILIGACDGGISDEQRSELTALLDAAEAHVAGLESARQEGLGAFMANPTGVPTECPDGLWLHEDPIEPFDRVDNFTVVERSELSEEEGTRSDRAGPIIHTMRTSLDPDGMIPMRSERFEERRGHAEQLGSAPWWPHEVTFVVTQTQVPRITGSDTFAPGFIAGKAVVWSYESGSVVCAFDHRTNSRATQEVRHGREA